MKTTLQRVPFLLSLLAGLGLVFIGGRFLLVPEAGETGFGITFAENGDYAFHYIKGIRDVFSGLLITLFTLLRQRKTLGLVLLTGALIPLLDAWVVAQQPTYPLSSLYPHLAAVLVCVPLGIWGLRSGKGELHAASPSGSGNAILPGSGLTDSRTERNFYSAT